MVLAAPPLVNARHIKKTSKNYVLPLMSDVPPRFTTHTGAEQLL